MKANRFWHGVRTEQSPFQQLHIDVERFTAIIAKRKLAYTSAMNELIYDIVQAIRCQGNLSEHQLNRIIQVHNREVRAPTRHFAKKMIWPAYLSIKVEHPELLEAWGVDDSIEAQLRTACRMKPRRTASGVATITVITRPAGCSSNCSFCPSDVRMPKSYIHDEPACQRAERNYFDPYLQVSSRLKALKEMGHPIDKVELIVLGATFTDYPTSYQVWFIHELFRTLNDWNNDATENQEQSWLTDNVETRQRRYQQAGILNDPDLLAKEVSDIQHDVAAGVLSFNQAIEKLYGDNSAWATIIASQHAELDQLVFQHTRNEDANARNVGLVVETRPDCLSEETLILLRQMGCTKIQIGIQSLHDTVLASCGRVVRTGAAAQASELLRIFGFKSHMHFMVNLPGATSEDDKRDWETFMNEAAYKPDEVKLYPLALIEGTQLQRAWEMGLWHPYSEDELVDVLVSDVLATPCHTRISRMIRDFSADSITAGNKKANLRQMVEEEVRKRADKDNLCVQEMRMREVGTGTLDFESLTLTVEDYATTNTHEYFLQWVDAHNTLAAFLRLSLPHADYLAKHSHIPLQPHCAMIREVHVYGTAARIHQQDGAAQHEGLGRQLIERACEIAHEQGYSAINVISAVGTRNYYRKLGFVDAGLYQQRQL